MYARIVYAPYSPPMSLIQLIELHTVHLALELYLKLVIYGNQKIPYFPNAFLVVWRVLCQIVLARFVPKNRQVPKIK